MYFKSKSNSLSCSGCVSMVITSPQSTEGLNMSGNDSASLLLNPLAPCHNPDRFVHLLQTVCVAGWPHARSAHRSLNFDDQHPVVAPPPLHLWTSGGPPLSTATTTERPKWLAPLLSHEGLSAFPQAWWPGPRRRRRLQPRRLTGGGFSRFGILRLSLPLFILPRLR